MEVEEEAEEVEVNSATRVTKLPLEMPITETLASKHTWLAKGCRIRPEKTGGHFLKCSISGD